MTYETRPRPANNIGTHPMISTDYAEGYRESCRKNHVDPTVSYRRDYVRNPVFADASALACAVGTIAIHLSTELRFDEQLALHGQVTPIDLVREIVDVLGSSGFDLSDPARVTSDTVIEVADRVRRRRTRYFKVPEETDGLDS